MLNLNDTIPSTEVSLRIPEVKAAADIEERAKFWEKLRAFYRTGVKPKEASNKFKIESLASEYFKHEIGGYEEDLDTEKPLGVLTEVLKEYGQIQHSNFKSELKQLIHAVNGLINPGSTQESESETYGFASEIIAFDEISKLIDTKEYKSLSVNRLNRLKATFESLKSGLKFLDKNEPIIIVDKVLGKELDESLRSIAEVRVVSLEGAMKTLTKTMDSRVNSVRDLVGAFRIAQLEIEDKYDEAIHDDYFAHFSWFRMTEAETQIIQPICFVTSTEYLSGHQSELSVAIASNFPYKVWVVNREIMSKPKVNIPWADAAHSFRQELSSFVISHRNCFFWQGMSGSGVQLKSGLMRSLSSHGPSIVHFLLPSDKHENTLTEAAASAGRYFPNVVYDPISGKKERMKLDISSNVEPDVDWPIFNIEVETGKGNKLTLLVEFTYADYKAIFQKKVEELLIVPPEYDAEDLVPLHQYLRMEEKDLYGKIPFIWMRDENYELLKAAVPNLWVISCLERLDNWRFIQDIAGNHSTSKDDGQIKQIPSENTKDQGAQMLDENAIRIAAERLISALLDDENLIKELALQSREVDMEEVAEVGGEEKVEESSNAWLETEECTSCNECTDKYPHLFKYNDDKQAFITDPTKGKYEELVKAAEKCPAACIHPGRPVNESEADIKELMKRAEKYN